MRGNRLICGFHTLSLSKRGQANFDPRSALLPREETTMTEKKGHGSETAKKANAKAARDGKKNPRKSAAAQAELGKKGAAAKK